MKKIIALIIFAWLLIEDLIKESKYVEDDRKFQSIFKDHKKLMELFIKNIKENEKGN